MVYCFCCDGFGWVVCMGWKEFEFLFGVGIGWVKVCCCCVCFEDMGIGCDWMKGVELIV